MKENNNEEFLHGHLSAKRIDDEDKFTGFDEITLVEVANVNNIILYEMDTDEFTYGFSIDEETVHELFPDFQLKEDKGYLIEKDDTLYYC